MRSCSPPPSPARPSGRWRALRARLSGSQVAATGLGLAVLALLGTSVAASQPAVLAAAFALVAVSFGLGQSALLNLLSAATPPEERGAALAVFMVVFFVGGGVGGTLLASLAYATSLTAAVAYLAVLPAGAALLAATIRPR
jgi:predicted MFS family arabinose efflux permease